jgi:hypothetical protein
VTEVMEMTRCRFKQLAAWSQRSGSLACAFQEEQLALSRRARQQTSLDLVAGSVALGILGMIRARHGASCNTTMVVGGQPRC